MQGLLERVQLFIPHSRLITKEEIFSLSDAQISLLDEYFKGTFPYVSNECLQYVKVIISNIFDNLNDGDIVISPGDSPSKVIKIIQTVFGNNDNYVFNNNGISTVKHIKFINFPISSVSSYVDPIVIDSYLLSILKANNVSSLNNLKYLDFIEGGGSYRNIVSSLQRITNSSYVIPAINLSNFQPSDENCKDALKLLFDVSEATQSRCLPNFNLYETRPLPANSILRCNVVIAMISLLLLGKLQF